VRHGRRERGRFFELLPIVASGPTRDVFGDREERDLALAVWVLILCEPEHDRRPVGDRHQPEHDLRGDVVGDGCRCAVQRASNGGQRLVDRVEGSAARTTNRDRARVPEAKGFWQAPTDKDLYDLAKQINAQVTDANLKAKDTAVMNAVDAVVLHRRFTGSKYSMVQGITITGISRPVEKNADWTYYHTLEFALTTGWDEFEDLFAS
jgi:hypothetical protein